MRAIRRRCHASSVPGVTMRCRRSSRGSSRTGADMIARSGHEGRGVPTWRRRTENSWRSTRISTSLAVERRRSKPSQPNNLTVIKYVSRNSTVGEHGTTWREAKRQVSEPTSSNGTVHGGAQDPDPSAGVLKHRQHVHPRPGQGRGLEEVACEQGVGLGAEEVGPRGGGALGRRIDPVASFRISHTVEAAVLIPRTSSSPWIRL